MAYGNSLFLGWMKYSISACSNSRNLKRKLRGAISFLKALPIWAIPNGSFALDVFTMLSKEAKINWAVSPLKYAVDDSDDSAPIFIGNIKLKLLMSLNSDLHLGQESLCFFSNSESSFAVKLSTDIFNFSSMKWSALRFVLHFGHSNSKSENPERCPEASQIF